MPGFLFGPPSSPDAAKRNPGLLGALTKAARPASTQGEGECHAIAPRWTNLSRISLRFIRATKLGGRCSPDAAKRNPGLLGALTKAARPASTQGVCHAIAPRWTNLSRISLRFIRATKLRGRCSPDAAKCHAGLLGVLTKAVRIRKIVSSTPIAWYYRSANISMQ